MEGKGIGPTLFELSGKNINNNFGNEFDEAIIEEFGCLQKKYSNIILEMVTDDSMSPFINIGDYVAGIPVDDISTLNKKICIIETIGGTNYVRELIKSTEMGKYHLKALKSDVEFPLIYNQVIKSAAEIIWIRRRPSIC